jgi:hypothetical protein
MIMVIVDSWTVVESKQIKARATGIHKFVTQICHSRLSPTHFHATNMATAVILGVGAVTAAILGRSIMRHGVFIGRGAAEEFVKGGFRAKMDRKEAVQILGLK